MIKLRVEIHFPFWLMEGLTEKAVDWNPSVGTYGWSWLFRDSSAVVFTGEAMEGFGLIDAGNQVRVPGERRRDQSYQKGHLLGVWAAPSRFPYDDLGCNMAFVADCAFPG